MRGVWFLFLTEAFTGKTVLSSHSPLFLLLFLSLSLFFFCFSFFFLTLRHSFLKLKFMAVSIYSNPNSFFLKAFHTCTPMSVRSINSSEYFSTRAVWLMTALCISVLQLLNQVLNRVTAERNLFDRVVNLRLPGNVSTYSESLFIYNTTIIRTDLFISMVMCRIYRYSYLALVLRG